MAEPKQKKKPAAKKPTPKKKPPSQRRHAVKVRAALSRQVEALGEITVPSGTLCVFDVGLVGYLPRPALEPALVKAQVPADRALAVVGQRVGKGRYADCWDHVAVRIGDGSVTHSKELGEAGVDFARLVCMDHGALDHWQHEDSLDGLADFLFWGRAAGSLARAMRAPAQTEGYGWIDLPVADADAKALAASKIKAENHWLLATDFRPHSHHYHALAAARQNQRGAGTFEVGGAKECLFFTSFCYVVFPFYLDLDSKDRPVQIRIQLNATDVNA